MEDLKKESERDRIFKEYNSADLLKIFAALQVIPQNHGKNLRLEKLAFKTIQFYNNNEKCISHKDLVSFLNIYYESLSAEDPPINLFTENIIFYGGDYTVFPGIGDYITFKISNLLSSLLVFDEEFLKKPLSYNFYLASCLMLRLSNSISSRLNYKRNLKGSYNEIDNLIFVPSKDRIDELKSAVTFTLDELRYIFKDDENVLKVIADNFLIRPNDDDFSEFLIEKNPLLLQPLFKNGNEIIVVLPTSLMFSLNGYIWEKSAKTENIKEVSIKYHTFISNLIRSSLSLTSSIPLEIEGYQESFDLPLKEIIFKIDIDKIVYLTYEYDDGSNFKSILDNYEFSGGLINRISERKKLITNQIKNTFNKFQILNINLLGAIGRNVFMLYFKDENSLTIQMQVPEFGLCCEHNDFEILDFWKIATYLKTESEFKEVEYIDFLDLYTTYKSHKDSLYLSDEDLRWITLMPGVASDFIAGVIINKDLHSAALAIDGKEFLASVIRADKYSPIYKILPGIHFEVAQLIEGFSQPFWIKPAFRIDKLNALAYGVVIRYLDAFSYWSWQLTDFIKDHLSKIGTSPLEIQFDFYDIESLKHIERNFNRAPNVIDKFKFKTKKGELLIVVPKELNGYLYGINNEGDRILVEAILIGINKLLREEFNILSLSEESFETIINKVAPLGLKKKIFIIDSQNDLRLDPRFKETVRFVQEHEKSILLDFIPRKLKQLKKTPPVGEITTVAAKVSLCRVIVMEVLLPLLREIASKFNSFEVLKKLIIQNESIIYEREAYRLTVPTMKECYSNAKVNEELNKKERKIDETSIAIRGLIEHLTAELSGGDKKISQTDYDYLLAIMEAIITWGDIGDHIFFLNNAYELTLLPSGRFGTDKKFFSEKIEPYINALSNELYKNSSDSFKSKFENEDQKKEKETIITDELDEAFKEQFDITLTKIIIGFNFLQNWIFELDRGYGEVDLSAFKNKMRTHLKDFDTSDIDAFIDYSSLRNRGKVENFPKGFDINDIKPWRTNRRLSYLRKPVIIINKDKTNLKENILLWGQRSSFVSAMYLIDICRSARLKTKSNTKLSSVIGKMANKKGNSFLKECLHLMEPLEFIKLESEKTIGPKGFFYCENELGDFDIIAIDSKLKKIFLIECKNVDAGINSVGMVEEIEKFLKEDNDNWIFKHKKRDEWAKKNLKELEKKFEMSLNNYDIASLFMTSEIVSVTYLKKEKLGLHFTTLGELKRNGKGALLVSG